MLLIFRADGRYGWCRPSDSENAAQVLLALHHMGVKVVWWATASDAWDETQKAKGGGTHEIVKT